MISGAVNASFEARISVVVQRAKGRQRRLSAVIDTGFNGFITLPPAIIASLKLVWRGRREATLADGRIELFEVYRARVLWHGQWRTVEADAIDATPLVGMALLEKSRLHMDVVSGGNVAIQSLP
jgi:clan AA aspartic protease